MLIWLSPRKELQKRMKACLSSIPKKCGNYLLTLAMG
jgi:hypothetical protein